MTCALLPSYLRSRLVLKAPFPKLGSTRSGRLRVKPVASEATVQVEGKRTITSASLLFSTALTKKKVSRLFVGFYALAIDGLEKVLVFFCEGVA